MKKLLLIAVLFLIGTPLIVCASDCKNEDLVNYKGKANLINTSLKKGSIYREFKDPDTSEVSLKEKTVMDYIISNIDDDLYVILYKGSVKLFDSRVDQYTGKEYKFTIDDFTTLSTMSLNVYAKKNGCEDQFLRNILDNVPKYNNNYNSQICSGISDFYLCQEFIYTNYNDINGFDSVINKYREGIIDKNGEKVEKKDSLLKKVRNFMIKYQFVFYCIVIFLGGFVILSITRRHYRIKKHIS